MLNEEKVRVMTKLAIYEQGEGKNIFLSANITALIISDWL